MNKRKHEDNTLTKTKKVAKTAASSQDTLYGGLVTISYDDEWYLRLKSGEAALMGVLVQFGSKWEMSEEVRLKYIEDWSQPGALTGSLNYYRTSPLYPPVSEADEELIRSILNLPKEMFEIKEPTMVIWGEQDQALLTGNLDGLAEYIEDLTVKRIPDGTHWVIHEQPELVNSLIREFIK